MVGEREDDGRGRERESVCVSQMSECGVAKRESEREQRDSMPFNVCVVEEGF